jgi:hypothetical protein
LSETDKVAKAKADELGKVAAKDTFKGAEKDAKAAAEKAYNDAVGQGRSPAEAEKAAKEAAEKAAGEAVNKRLNQLGNEGHGPQRHGPKVTDQQLQDRAMNGIDPMSGTTTDAVTGQPHKYSKNATKINEAKDYVKGEEHVRESQTFKDKVADADANGKDRVVVDDSKLEDIYGHDYQDKVSGKTRTGTKNNPTGTVDTDFTDGHMVAVYDKNPATGQWELTTMYPDPR